MKHLVHVLLAVLLALVLLPGLGAIAAIDTREARDAQVVREIADGREWITPVLGHDPFFEKPLLGYAPELAAQRARLLPGPAAAAIPGGAAASRLVRALLAAALALLVGVAGTRAFGARAGGLAACVFVTSAGLSLAARTDGAQLLATLCAWFGITALLDVLQGRARAPELVGFLSWLAFGAAMLVGGPLPALWPLAGFALYFTLARSRTGWSAVRPLPGLLVVAGLALPWYGLVAALYHGAFLSHVAWFPYAADARESWFVGPLRAMSFPVVLGFPWVPMLGVALRDGARRLRARSAAGVFDLRESNHAASLLLAMLVAASVPVALYPRPPLTAALPALPALALLVGRFLDRVLDGDVETGALTSATRVGAAVGSLLALLVAALAARMPEAAAAMRELAALLFVTAWAPLLAEFAGRRRLAAALFALPVALGAPLLATRVLPAIEPWLNTRDVAEVMEQVAPPRAALALLEPPPPSLRLLLGRNLVVIADPARDLAALAAADGESYVAVPPARERELARRAPAPIEILRRSPVLVLARVRTADPAAWHAAPPAAR